MGEKMRKLIENGTKRMLSAGDMRNLYFLWFARGELACETRVAFDWRPIEIVLFVLNHFRINYVCPVIRHKLPCLPL